MKKRFWLLLALVLEIFTVTIILNSSRHYRNWLYALITQKQHVRLIVGVISAPRLAERRHAIRHTWLQMCHDNSVLICKFFVDSLEDMEPNIREKIIKENVKYNDIEFMQVPPGVNFGRRILWLLEWSAKNYVFDFVLRVDDDVFVCLHRLLHDLQFRQEKRIYWGYIHCAKHQIRVDEEFLVMSYDLVNEFLNNKHTLQCSPFGDISVALWVNNVPDVTYIHDDRINHEAREDDLQLFEDVNLCHNFLAINSAYKTQTFRYWINVEREMTTNFEPQHVRPFNALCDESRTLKWQEFAKGHRFEPILCIRKPSWSSLGSTYLGRKGQLEKLKSEEKKRRLQKQRKNFSHL